MGANLEVFKFSLYLFVPLFAMVHFGDPDWYEHHVQPLKEKYIPTKNNRPPKTQPELKEELARLRDERLGRPHVAATEVPKSEVLAAVSSDSRKGAFDWAEGEKRLV